MKKRLIGTISAVVLCITAFISCDNAEVTKANNNYDLNIKCIYKDNALDIYEDEDNGNIIYRGGYGIAVVPKHEVKGE